MGVKYTLWSRTSCLLLATLTLIVDYHYLDKLWVIIETYPKFIYGDGLLYLYAYIGLWYLAVNWLIYVLLKWLWR